MFFLLCCSFEDSRCYIHLYEFSSLFVTCWLFIKVWSLNDYRVIAVGLYEVNCHSEFSLGFMLWTNNPLKSVYAVS